MNTRIYFGAFIFGTMFGMGIMARAYEQKFARAQYKFKQVHAMGMYMAHILAERDVPFTEFDAIVINSIARGD